MKREYRVSGDTYKAREVLRAAGFDFDKMEKVWYGGEEEKEELVRITKRTYSSANQNKFVRTSLVNVETGEETRIA